MDDKPTGDTEQQKGAHDAAQPPLPPLSQKKEASNGGTDPDAGKDTPSTQAQPKSRWQRFKTWVWPMEFTNAVMIVLTAFIALGTIVSAVAIGFQWHEMRTGGADTKAIAEASKQQACSARQIAAASQRNATAAEGFASSADSINTKIGAAEGDFARMAGNSADSIKATQDAMRLEQRAWVAASGITGTPKVGEQFTTQVTAINSGRTFAKHFVMITDVQVAPAGTRPAFEKENGVSFDSLSLLPPNGMYIAKNTVTGEGSKPFISNPTQTDIDAIKSGKVVILVFGRMDYVDIFRKSHWEVFCYKLDPDLNWVNCKEHNDADDN